MLCQGISGCAACREGETRFVASPSTISWRITASWRSWSRKNISRSRPSACRRAISAASAMSKSHAASRSSNEERLQIAEDMAFPERVGAALHGPPLHQVHLAAEDLRQLVPHGHDVEEAPLGAGGEPDEDIHVALRLEILPQRRAEEPRLRD